MELTTNYGWSMPEPTDPVNSSAEYAENMELIDGVVKDIADEVTAVDQGLTALALTVAGKVSKAGDTMTGALNMGGSKIQNVATPTAGSDAATKAYVDNIATVDLIKKDGSVDFEANQSMGGHKLTNLPTSGSYNAGDAIPKQYVTDNAVTYAEGLTADLNANNQKISALGTPTFNYDATTKKYVDDADADKVSKSDTAKQTIQSILMFDEGGGIGWDGVTYGVKVYAPNASSEGDLTCGNLYAGAIEAAGIENHNERITGVAEPINNNDVATKGYVDALHPLIINATKVNNEWTFDKTISEVILAGVNSVIHLHDGGTYVAPLKFKDGVSSTDIDIIWKCEYSHPDDNPSGYHVTLFHGEWDVTNFS